MLEQDLMSQRASSHQLEDASRRASQKDGKREEKPAADAPQEFKTREWLPMTIGATLGFTFRTNFIAEVTKGVGPFTCLYLAFGGTLMSAGYFLFAATRNKVKPGGKFMVDFNLVKNGKPKPLNIFGLVIFCLLYFVAQNVVYVTIWTSLLANMNVGIVSVLWSVTPLIVACVEYIIYKISLKCNYIIGLVLMVISAAVLSLNTMLANSQKAKPIEGLEHERQEAAVSSWVPVVFALIGPLCFTARVILIRRMTVQQYGICFDATTLTMLIFFIDNLLMLVAAIIYWQFFAFDAYLFLMGTIGIVLDCAALNMVYIALGRGPGGPITALCCASSIGVTVIECLRSLKLPTYIEMIGGIIGFIGALEFVIPEQIERIFCPWKNCRRGRRSTSNAQTGDRPDKTEQPKLPEKDDQQTEMLLKDI